MSQEKEERISEFDYELSKPITYGDKSGTAQEATFIKFKAPSSKQIDLCSDLKQYFFQAIRENEEGSRGKDNSDEDKKTKLTGSDVIGLMSMSTRVKLRTVVLTAQQLFKVKGIALVDGEVSLNTHMMSEMDIDEMHDMIGEYLVNFTLASVLKKLNES